MREVRGDCLADSPGPDDLKPLLFSPDSVVVCFAAIAQEDQLGVDLLASLISISFAPLVSCQVVLACLLPRPSVGRSGPKSVEVGGSCPEPACISALKVAKEAYALYGLQGSDDKDQWGLDFSKIAGAELNSSAGARALGLVTVSAPAKKRAALSLISLELSALSHTSDALHLSLLGGWTSALLYRRPLMSVLSRSYGLVRADRFDPRRPKLIGLTREVAQEFVLLSVLAPLASSELSAPSTAPLPRMLLRARVPLSLPTLACHSLVSFTGLVLRKGATHAFWPVRRLCFRSLLTLNLSNCVPYRPPTGGGEAFGLCL